MDWFPAGAVAKRLGCTVAELRHCPGLKWHPRRSLILASESVPRLLKYWQTGLAKPAARNVWVVDHRTVVYSLSSLTSPEAMANYGVLAEASDYRSPFQILRDICFMAWTYIPAEVKARHPRQFWHIVVADDPPPYWRTGVCAALGYDRYKGTRGEKPKEWKAVDRAAQRTLSAAGIPVLKFKSFEADDIVAEVAKQIREIPEFTGCVYTVDSDLLQLVSDKHGFAWYNVARWDPKYRGFSEACGYFSRRTNCPVARPRDIVAIKAKKGDTADNLPANCEPGLIDLFDPLVSLSASQKAVISAALKGAPNYDGMLEMRREAVRESLQNIGVGGEFMG